MGKLRQCICLVLAGGVTVSLNQLAVMNVILPSPNQRGKYGTPYSQCYHTVQEKNSFGGFGDCTCRFCLFIYLFRCIFKLRVACPVG